MSTHLKNIKAFSVDLEGEEDDVARPCIAGRNELIIDGMPALSLFAEQAKFLSPLLPRISGADFDGFGAMLHAWDENSGSGDERHYLLDVLIALFERLADDNVVLSDHQADLVRRYFLHGNPLPGLAKLNQSVRGTVDWLLDKVVYFEPMVGETAGDLAGFHEDLVCGNVNSENAHQLVRRHEEAFKEKYDYCKDVDLFEPSASWYVYSH
tara:strand:- start:330 stop:959 length:630 start_codon:yes stop_codon:yes gene_type:complete